MTVATLTDPAALAAVALTDLMTLTDPDPDPDLMTVNAYLEATR